jgi:molybdopterin/thiamine biosynthesis adenylyltransferase
VIVLAGVGGLGAPSALEFARAGVRELRLIDADYVDPGTSVRWPLGLGAAGLPKVGALKSFIEAHWPYTRVVAIDHRIGGIRQPGEPPEEEIVLSALSEASLVYDATAEWGVQHFLSDLSREEGMPYVCTWTAAGAWGGLVARVSPDPVAPCWRCLMYALEQGEIPSPPFDPEGEVQPVGCADPTFTGSGFDLGLVGLLGVQLAASTVAGDGEGAYPGCDWDVALMIHRRERQRLTPAIETYPLKRWSECPGHE